MNDELNTTNNVNQPAAAAPAPNEVLTPEAQQPMEDPIEAPVEPEVKTPAESGTFTPPVAGMVPTGWAFPQDLASSLAMTTEDPEVASTGVDEVNQPTDDVDAGGPSEELPESVKGKKKWASLRGLLQEKGSKKLQESVPYPDFLDEDRVPKTPEELVDILNRISDDMERAEFGEWDDDDEDEDDFEESTKKKLRKSKKLQESVPYPDFLDEDRVPETPEELVDILNHINDDMDKVDRGEWGEWDDDEDDEDEDDFEESAKKKLRKSKKLHEEFDLEEDSEEEEPEDAEDHDESEEPEDDCESCEDLEENPEEIPDLLDTIADILRKKDFDGSDEFEDEDEDEFEGGDFPAEDLEMDEAVKYPAGSKPAHPVEASATQALPKTPVSYEDDIIRQYEKRALARKALIEKLKKPLWEKELDEIADTDERDKEIGYKSIDDAIDEGSLGEKFDRALKNPFEESYKGASGWAAHNNLGRLSEKRLNFRKMIGKGFLD